MPNEFVRISRSYDDVKQLISLWALRCDKLIAYEHEADDEVSRTHMHILMYGMNSTWDNFQKLAKKEFSIVAEFNGNSDWAKSRKYQYDAQATIKYMTKGILEPKYVKGYTDEEIAAAKALWKPEQERKTKDQEMYGEFVEQNPGCEDWQFEHVREHARRYAFWQTGRVWNARAGAIARMLIYTHYMNFGFTLPDAWDVRM